MSGRIPKIIHYCWFGEHDLPETAKKCVASWKKYMPEYEIKKWDESNFDINIIPYTAEAYQYGKYAFVSDYARYWILYNFGGLYFDTDVEIIRPMDKIVSKGPFMGCERDPRKNGSALSLSVAPGLGMGSYGGHPFYKKMLDLYSDLHFVNKNGTRNKNTVVTYTTALLVEKGLRNIPEIQCIDDINIYPRSFFCPMDIGTREVLITKDTYSIHHYDGSWMGAKGKFKNIIKLIVGKKIAGIIVKFKRRCGF